jgi:hypothetical protein
MSLMVLGEDGSEAFTISANSLRAQSRTAGLMQQGLFPVTVASCTYAQRTLCRKVGVICNVDGRPIPTSIDIYSTIPCNIQDLTIDDESRTVGQIACMVSVVRDGLLAGSGRLWNTSICVRRRLMDVLLHDLIVTGIRNRRRKPVWLKRGFVTGGRWTRGTGAETFLRRWLKWIGSFAYHV